MNLNGVSLQNQLVSGSNIKTLNNISLLGSGNINVNTGKTKVRDVLLESYTSASVTNTTTETALYSYPIPANTFTTGGLLDISCRVLKTGTLSSWSFRMYKNTSNSLTGATLIATANSATGASVTYSEFIRKYRLTGGTIKGYNFGVASTFDFISNANGESSTTFALNVDNWFLFAVQFGTATTDSIVGAYWIIVGYE